MTTGSSPQIDAERRAVLAIDLPRVEVGPGCFRRDLPSRQGLRLWLVEMLPGAEWPHVDRHDQGGEDIYVVDGELIEGEDRFCAGTFIAFAGGSAHRPRTEGGVVLFGVNLLHDPAERREISKGRTFTDSRGGVARAKLKTSRPPALRTGKSHD